MRAVDPERGGGGSAHAAPGASAKPSSAGAVVSSVDLAMMVQPPSGNTRLPRGTRFPQAAIYDILRTAPA